MARRLLLLTALLLLLPRDARADDDPMAAYRERFKAGMERYGSGDLPAAIADWEAIYREVGPEKGYRVAFDLARAYDKSGDPSRARERYLSFLGAVDHRRAAGVALEPVVLQEETEARTRVTELPSPSPPVAAAPPAPAPAAGPTPAPATASTPATAPTPAPTTAPTPAPAPAPPAVASRPFSPLVLVAAGGATIAAITVCTVEYANALSDENAFRAASAQPVSVQANLKSTYDRTVPLAYGALGASIGLAAVTAGLTAWYFAGTKTHEPALVPSMAATPGGAQLSLLGRF